MVLFPGGAIQDILSIVLSLCVNLKSGTDHLAKKKKNGRPFMKVNLFFFPFHYRFCFYPFLFSCYVNSNAKPGGRLQIFNKYFQQLIIAVWCFDKYLGAIFFWTQFPIL